MTFLWQPGGLPPLRVRRNPQASLYQPVLEPDDWGYDNLITPNGIATLNGADDVVASLHKAGTRGAVALGAVAGGLITLSAKGAIIGGVLGYLGGKYVVGLADKMLAASALATKVEKATS